MTQKVREQTQESDLGVDARVARHGGLSYLEIAATDVRQSGRFYEQVLGWKLDWRGSEDRRFEDRTGHLIGHMVAGRAIAGDPGLLPYFYVDRIDEAVERA